MRRRISRSEQASLTTEELFAAAAAAAISTTNENREVGEDGGFGLFEVSIFVSHKTLDKRAFV